MIKPTLEELLAYLDDALSDVDTARVEQSLRESAGLRERLRELMGSLDRGEHSVGAIWRRERLSCPTRSEWGAFLLGAAEPRLAEHLRFHLDVIGCPFCRANVADLQERRREGAAGSHNRRKKLFDSSKGYLPK